MYRFFVEEGQIGQGEAVITGGDVNHIRNVLRMRPGDKVMVSDGKERDYCCRLKEIGCDRVIADILEEKPAETELPARLYLFQGLPKSDKMELIIQKAVELGAVRIVPVATENAVVKLEPKREANKRRRWQAIAESAAMQSKRSLIPEVARVLSFKEALEDAAGSDVALFAYEHQKGMAGTREELARVAPGQRIALFIGPEGGFAPQEVLQAEAAGFRPVSLGKRILRTETAGLALLSILMLQLELEGER